MVRGGGVFWGKGRGRLGRLCYVRVLVSVLKYEGLYLLVCICGCISPMRHGFRVVLLCVWLHRKVIMDCMHAWTQG